MSESMALEVVDPSTTPTLANKFDMVDLDAAEAFMNNYQELCKRLLDKSDYQKIGQKHAKKKSAWRKLATAFNISDEIINEEITRDETGQIVSAKYHVRATLPNGRSSVRVGSCSIYDKIRYNPTSKFPADTETPSNFELRGRFSNAEHDVLSTAHTRAKNGAIADLVGNGENSAEEMDNVKPKNGAPPTPKSAPKKKSPKKAPAKKVKEEPIETKAEVVEAEVVSEDKEQKKKSMTIKELMDNNQHIKKAVNALQDQEINVSRATISEKLMDLWDMGKIEKADYDVAINELKQ